MGSANRKPTEDASGPPPEAAMPPRQVRSKSRQHPKTADKRPRIKLRIQVPRSGKDHDTQNAGSSSRRSVEHSNSAAVAVPGLGSRPHTLLAPWTAPGAPSPETVLRRITSAQVTAVPRGIMRTQSTSASHPTRQRDNYQLIDSSSSLMIDMSAITTPPGEAPEQSPNSKVGRFLPPLQDTDPDAWRGFLESPLKPKREAPAVIQPDEWKNQRHSLAKCTEPANHLHKHFVDAPELAQTIQVLVVWRIHLLDRLESFARSKAQADIQHDVELGHGYGKSMIHLRRMLQVIENREDHFRNLIGTGFVTPGWVRNTVSSDWGYANWKNFVRRCVYPNGSQERIYTVRGDPCSICGSGSWRGPDA